MKDLELEMKSKEHHRLKVNTHIKGTALNFHMSSESKRLENISPKLGPTWENIVCQNQFTRVKWNEGLGVGDEK